MIKLNGVGNSICFDRKHNGTEVNITQSIEDFRNIDLKERVISFGKNEIPINILTAKLSAEVKENGDVYLVYDGEEELEFMLLGKVELTKHQSLFLRRKYIEETGDLNVKKMPFYPIYWSDDDFKDKRLDLKAIIEKAVKEKF